MGIIGRGVGAFALALLSATPTWADAPQGKSAQAAALKPGSAAMVLASMQALRAITYSLSLDVGDWAKAREVADEAVADLDAGFPDAHAKLKGHADAQAALKTYYLAAKTYFRDSWPSSSSPAVVAKANEERLKQAMSSARDALEMELKLGGLAN